jgi:hypothetical protein
VRVTERIYDKLKEIIDYYAEEDSDYENMSVSKFVEGLMFKEIRDYHAMRRRM